jgi:hypothetical protein
VWCKWENRSRTGISRLEMAATIEKVEDILTRMNKQRVQNSCYRARRE